jgi:hypothetical protein
VVVVPGLHLGGGAGEVYGIAVGLLPAEDAAEGGALLDGEVVLSCGHSQISLCVNEIDCTS